MQGEPWSGVSVVVPVYNGARLVERLVQEVAASLNGEPYELLLIEDGSQDPQLGRNRDGGFAFSGRQGF